MFCNRLIISNLVFFLYLCGMKKDEIISMLQQQIAFLQQQLGDANRKVDELLRKVSSLEDLLVQKNAEEQKQHNIIKGLTKIQQNRSEKQTPSVAASNEPAPNSNDVQADPEPKPREKTNYGARRKEHYEVEIEEEDVYPTDARFDEMKARLIDTRDVVRYILVPMRFIKKIYHVSPCSSAGLQLRRLLHCRHRPAALHLLHARGAYREVFC